MDYENSQNPFDEWKQSIAAWKDIAIIDCDLSDRITDDARKLMELGLRQKDASHLACAINACADFFITTDKKILNKPVTGIQLINPVDFARRYLDEE